MVTVPALPADDSDGNDWTAAKVNAIYDHLEYHRNDRNLIQHTIVADGTDMATIATATTTDIEFSDGSGASQGTVGANVGPFTFGSGGVKEILVPVAGVYWITAHAVWAADSTGIRTLALTDTGSPIASGTVVSDPIDTPINTAYQHVSTIQTYGSGDRMGVEVTQNSGSNVNVTVILSAFWVNSAAT